LAEIKKRSVIAYLSHVWTNRLRASYRQLRCRFALKTPKLSGYSLYAVSI
jgi:hypothetical protein